MQAQTFRKTFTLIELLVVIAIISILASMLLPALKSARGMAIKSACQGTQKSIGYAHAMYMSDYFEYMAGFSPDVFGGNVSGVGGYTSQAWITKLAQYVNVDVSLVQNGTYSSLKPCDNPQTRNVLCCPKRPWGVFGVNGAAGADDPGNFSSYHVSYMLDDQSVPTWNPRKIVICAKPSSKVYMGDAANCCGGYWPNRFSPNLTPELPPTVATDIEIRHNMTANFLFLDGHVDSYGRSALPMAGPAWNVGLEWIDPSYSVVPNSL